MPKLSEAVQNFAVNSQPDHSRMLSHTDEQMVALERVHSDMQYAAKPFGLGDLFNREAKV